MCVAIAVPRGVAAPDLETLEQCEWGNQDGAGVAWADDDHVHWIKGLDAKDVADVCSYAAGPKLIHFRLATAGPDVDALCHPFPIEKRASTALEGRTKKPVLIHNGTWSDWDDYAAILAPLPSGPWSDTRLMARIIATHGREWLGKFVHNMHVGKLATLDSTGHLILAGDWHERAGVHYSNVYWEWTNKYRIGDYAMGSVSDRAEPTSDREYVDWWKKQSRSTRQERLGGKSGDSTYPYLPEELK